MLSFLLCRPPICLQVEITIKCNDSARIQAQGRNMRAPRSPPILLKQHFLFSILSQHNNEKMHNDFVGSLLVRVGRYLISCVPRRLALWTASVTSSACPEVSNTGALATLHGLCFILFPRLSKIMAGVYLTTLLDHPVLAYGLYWSKRGQWKTKRSNFHFRAFSAAQM